MTGAPGTAGIVLAAGFGTRLAPLTDLRPKALCPVANRPLIDHAFDRLRPVVGDALAANAFHHGERVVAHCAGRAFVHLEDRPGLGTAGGVAGLRDWLDGRHALVTNADAYLSPGALDGFTHGWDGARCRLLCVPAASSPDFTGPDGTGLRYVGACLVPAALVATLPPGPAGLYEVLWRGADLDLVTAPPGTVAIDCGTPADYLAANRAAAPCGLVDPTARVTGRVVRSVVGAGAVVEGDVEDCVVWDGATVAAGERLTGAIRP